MAQCEATMKTKADTSPDAMQKMLTAFQHFGVTREQIESESNADSIPSSLRRSSASRRFTQAYATE